VPVLDASLMPSALATGVPAGVPEIAIDPDAPAAFDANET